MRRKILIQNQVKTKKKIINKIKILIQINHKVIGFQDLNNQYL